MKKNNKQLEEDRRIYSAIKNKIAHFAPTISPAPKDMEYGHIESIKMALEYYKELGVDKVVLQPKYMGSYCDIEICRDIEESRFISKRGFLINHVDKTELLEALQPFHNSIFSHPDNITLSKILIASELMPWSVLGSKLIERDFNSYYECMKSHLQYLKDTNLLEHIKLLKSNPQIVTFESDEKVLSKKDLYSKYPDHYVRRTFRALNDINLIDVDWYQTGIQIYEHQLHLYAKQGKVEIKPFAILKYFYLDGSEEIQENNPDNLKEYGLMDNFIVVDLNDPEAYEKCWEFNNNVLNIQHDVGNEIWTYNAEGIMIKPYKMWIPNCVPALKVRNDQYLHLIYGVNFGVDYDYYIDRRKVGKKIKCSINEWNISQQLLRINEKDISKDNDAYVNLIINRIKEEYYENQLDTRL